MMGELERVDNKQWVWIIIAVLLLSSCSSGTGGIGGLGNNFLAELKCGNNSWIWILVLIFLFSDGF